MVTGPRETESASAYNLKTHSAFKLLTIAAGYKVLCRYHGEREACRGSWGSEEGRARFKSLIYLRGDCGRHDGATAGRSGADSRWGVQQKKRIEEQRRISLPASRRPRMCGTTSLRGCLCLSLLFLLFSWRFDRK